MPADAVFQALTDFSDKRAAYFPNLSKGSYRLIEQTDKTAVVIEGAGTFRSRERYDWSTPGRIRSVVEESNVVAPGGITDVRVERRAGGCQVAVALEREYIGWRGKLILSSIYVNGRSRFFRRTYLRMLKNVQRERNKKGKRR